MKYPKMAQIKPKKYFFTALSNIFHNQIDCTVIFKCPVESESDETGIIGAHKMILGLSSEVFLTMFFGEMAKVNEKQTSSEADEKSDKKSVSDIEEIEVDDIELETFKVFLSFIYGDDVTNLLNLENAFKFFYAAHKYMCKDAIDFIADYLIKKIAVETVTRIVDATHLFKNNLLIAACSKFTIRNTDKVLKDDSFLEADPYIVYGIFLIDKLRIDSELDLVEALERYIEYNKPDDPDIVEKVRPALNRIHFLTLDTKDILKTTLLTPTEKIDVISCLQGDLSKMPSGLSKKGFEARTYILSEVQIIRILTDIYSSKICYYCYMLQKKSNHAIWTCSQIAQNSKTQFWNIYRKYKHVSLSEYIPVDLKALYDIYNEIGCLSGNN